MRDEIAKRVFPVIEHALDVIDRLRLNEPVSVADEHAALREMLLPGVPDDDESLEDRPEVRLPADYIGEVAGVDSKPGFLGVLYALVCWLDEKFIGEEQTRELWSRQPLEGALYGSNDRAWRFWQQAQLAEKLRQADALEVYYLCVMLGFRGGQQETPEKVSAWTASTARRLQQATPAWHAPAALAPVIFVPPLLGGDAVQHMLFAAGAVLLGAIPLAAFLLARELVH